MAHERTTNRNRAVYTLPSILSIVAAVVSFTTGAGWGLLLALVAIVLGGLGVLLSIVPGKRGGMVSVAAILLGAIGVVAAFIKVLI